MINKMILICEYIYITFLEQIFNNVGDIPKKLCKTKSWANLGPLNLVYVY